MKLAFRRVVSISVFLLAIAHALGWPGIDFVALAYVALAIVVWLFDDFQEFSFGKDGFSFKRQASQALENYGLGGKPSNTSSNSCTPNALRELTAGLDDPNKNKFGGSPVVNGKSMMATVQPYPGNQDWYFIRIMVVSIDVRQPLTGKVTFFLHPSFKTSVIEKASVGGKAVLETVAWGSFTVGAVCESDQTNLELDLSEIPEVPKAFKNR